MQNLIGHVAHRALTGATNAALTLVASTGLLFSSGCVAYGQGEKTPFMEKSLAGMGISQVNAETSGGNIMVMGAHDGDARLEVYVWANDHHHELSHDELQKKLDENYELTIDVKDHTLTVIAKPKQHMFNWNNNVSVSYRIYVPSAVSTMLRTSGGNIVMKDLTGKEQNFKTSGGNLDLTNLGGRITGHTSGGNIIINGGKGDDIDLATSGGNIEASHCSSPTIRLETSGGNVGLNGLTGSVRASTSGGNVTGGQVDGELSTHTSGGNVDLRDMSGSLEASTSGGEISVHMRRLGKYLTIGNSSGDVSLTIPAGQGVDLRLRGSHISTSGLSDFKGQTEEGHMNGTLAGGGIPVKVDGGSGRVSLAVR